jgi:peroxiredoxin
VGTQYEVTRPESDEYAAYAQRIAYLIDPGGVIRRAYEVSDVEGFAELVLEDLPDLLKS